MGSMRKGFTLIEVMIVVGVVVIIAMIALPNLLIAKCMDKHNDKDYCIDQMKTKEARRGLQPKSSDKRVWASQY